MTAQDSTIMQTIALLICYGFEIKGKTSEQIVNYWLTKYTPNWLRLATIEALYLGRYKAVSVEQILSIWLRKGTPLYHFNHDFERSICRKLPTHLQTIPRNSEHNDRNGNNHKKFLQLAPTANKQTPLKTANSLQKNSARLTVCQENLTKEITTTNYQLAGAKVALETKPQKTIAYTPNWAATNGDRKSIDRFMPLPDRSQFYLKLKAVAKKNAETT